MNYCQAQCSYGAWPGVVIDEEKLIYFFQIKSRFENQYRVAFVFRSLLSLKAH